MLDTFTRTLVPKRPSTTVYIISLVGTLTGLPKSPQCMCITQGKRLVVRPPHCSVIKQSIEFVPDEDSRKNSIVKNDCYIMGF